MIKGNNIYLRPILKSDIDYLNQWKNDEEVYKYLGGGFSPISIDQQQNWLDSMIDLTGNNRRYLICDKNDIPLGLVGLYGINWIHRTCEMGIYIGDKNSHGHGFGKQASFLIEQFGKNSKLLKNKIL